MKLSEAVNRVIDLGRKVHDYYAAELPRRYPNYPLTGLDEENLPPPPEEAELRDFLATLPDEMVYQLIRIMYLGRGDFGTDDLAGHDETLRETFGTAGDAAAQMMFYKAALADELSDGLEELHKHKINVDKMPLKRIKVRKR
jgi:hypothetical protein